MSDSSPDPRSNPERGSASVSLVVRRTIHAGAATLFEAWTQAELLTRWWGPEGVRCPCAEVDLQVGGRFRIANEFSDGKRVWISGEFERIDAPHLLVYTWRVEPQEWNGERVTVRFEPRNDATEVVVIHECIP